MGKQALARLLGLPAIFMLSKAELWKDLKDTMVAFVHGHEQTNSTRPNGKLAVKHSTLSPQCDQKDSHVTVGTGSIMVMHMYHECTLFSLLYIITGDTAIPHTAHCVFKCRTPGASEVGWGTKVCDKNEMQTILQKSKSIDCLLFPILVFLSRVNNLCKSIGAYRAVTKGSRSQAPKCQMACVVVDVGLIVPLVAAKST